MVGIDILYKVTQQILRNVHGNLFRSCQYYFHGILKIFSQNTVAIHCKATWHFLKFWHGNFLKFVLARTCSLFDFCVFCIVSAITIWKTTLFYNMERVYVSSFPISSSFFWDKAHLFSCACMHDRSFFNQTSWLRSIYLHAFTFFYRYHLCSLNSLTMEKIE